MHRRHGFRGWDTHRLKGGVLASLDGRIAASAWRVSIRLVTAATRRRLTQTDDCLSPNAPRLIVLYDRQTTTRRPRAYRPLLPLAYKHDLLLLPVATWVTRASTVADGPARRAASRALCCTLRWIMLSVTNWPSSTVHRRKYCQLSSTDDRCQFITLSVHLCLSRENVATICVPWRKF